jgi:hypothetical protein
MSTSIDFYLRDEFLATVASGITVASVSGADSSDATVYAGKAEIRVKQSVVQNLFQYWSDSTDMTNASAADLFYKVNYTSTEGYNATPASAVPLSADFVSGAIISLTDMNPDAQLTNYLPQDYLRYLSKSLFNTTRGVDLFSNEAAVLTSIDVQSRLALNTRLNALKGGATTVEGVTTYTNIFDSNNIVIGNPESPEETGSAVPTGNPSYKILSRLLNTASGLDRLVDISTYQVDSTNWYKMPILTGDNIYFPLTISAPTDQQQLTNSTSTTVIADRVYQIRCVVVDDSTTIGATATDAICPNVDSVITLYSA